MIMQNLSLESNEKQEMGSTTLTEWKAEIVCSVDVEKAFDKIQHPVLIFQTVSKLGREGEENFSNLVKGISKKHIKNNINSIHQKHYFNI